MCFGEQDVVIEQAVVVHLKFSPENMDFYCVLNMVKFPLYICIYFFNISKSKGISDFRCNLRVHARSLVKNRCDVS